MFLTLNHICPNTKEKWCQMKLLRLSTCCGICASQRYFQAKFWISLKTLYSQNDSEGILQIPLCVAAKLIRPHSKSGAYMVEKDSGCCILGIVGNKLTGPLLIYWHNHQWRPWAGWALEPVM